MNRALQRERLAARGLAPSEVELLLAPLPVRTVQVTKSGQERTGGEGSFLVAMVFMALLFIPSLVYGQEVMRGVIQEKTDRVVEILVSSMTPMELLSGKILGMAAVGLTQMAVWMTMGGLLLGSGLSQAQTAGLDLSTILRPSVAVWFVVFFLLSYLVTVGAYAAGGSIVSSEKEAQQVLTPVMLVFMVPWFLMMPILTNPDSNLSVVLSLVPIYTPMTMFVRILVSEPPAWQVALSLVLSVGDDRLPPEGDREDLPGRPPGHREEADDSRALALAEGRVRSVDGRVGKSDSAVGISGTRGNSVAAPGSELHE